MSIPSELLKYVQNSERLVVISLVVFLSATAAHTGEKHGLFDFSGLPEWWRPAFTLAWILTGLHVLVRFLIFLGTGCQVILHSLIAFPQKRRQAKAQKPIIDSLIAIEGLAREVLCYALYRSDNHIWVDADTQEKWLLKLKHSGVIERSAADWGTEHYRIHRVAWAYMKKYPDRFIYEIPWPEPPWNLKLDEREIEKKLLGLNSE
ncbi:MAG: hypothetical protein ACFCUR_04810 [Rhodomicrobiaceae bacterium]